MGVRNQDIPEKRLVKGCPEGRFQRQLPEESWLPDAARDSGETVITTATPLQYLHNLSTGCPRVWPKLLPVLHLLWPCADWGFPAGSETKKSACNAGDRVQSLGQEDPLEKEVATHSSVLAWRIPWTENSGGLLTMGSQRVGLVWGTTTFTRAD